MIEAKLNDLVSLEKNPILRLVPLEIKTPFLLAGTTLGGRSITAIYSNVGIIRMPEDLPEIHSEIRAFCKYGQPAAVLLFFWG